MKLPKSIRPEEFEKLVKAINTKDIDSKIAFLLAYESGLRVSEIVGLKELMSKCCRAKINCERFKNVNGNNGLKYICTKCGKELDYNKETRRYPESEWRIEPLTKDRFQSNGILIRGKGSDGGKERVVPIPKTWRQKFFKHLPINKTGRTLDRNFRKYADKAGLRKELCFHSLRHGFATRCLELGMPINMVSMLLGHSSIAVTSIYTKANPVDAINKYKELF